MPRLIPRTKIALWINAGLAEPRAAAPAIATRSSGLPHQHVPGHPARAGVPRTYGESPILMLGHVKAG